VGEREEENVQAQRKLDRGGLAGDRRL
jgi:Ca2+-binding RTX toxin-like protein